MITLEHIYWLTGVMMAGVAWINFRDRTNPRWFNNAAFWGIYAVTFLVGSYLSDLVNGFLVIAMVGVASVRGLGQGKIPGPTRATLEASAQRWGNKLFIPALTIPVVTVLGTFVFRKLQIGGSPVVVLKDVTVISLAIATVIALAVGMLMLRPPPSTPVKEARRLLDAVGWAAVLPQMLAALGALFALAGVGTVVSGLASKWIPVDNPVAVVITYALGMAVFTMIMGNAFAAFPVMTAGIGLPLIVQRFGGDPAIMAAIGMLSGFCGTLMTPMAANFNIVPTALLELPDENAVIKVQIPTALLLLACNILLMNFLVFRH
ncbi:MAG TPA: DUF979 domain-containing protein [Gemmatimonadaceae bacterium]|nr:DUF979 domain-containing protein [Gemmatimonadaceae bacterium]